MIFELIFDVETQKLFSDITSDDPADLLISLVSLYRRTVDEEGNEKEGEMRSFWTPSLGISPTIDDMWDWFEHADRIIGFNSKKFDIPVLRPHYSKDIFQLPHFDILEKVRDVIGRRISLNALLQNTLGVSKIDIGTNAVYYFANPTMENLKKLQSYCESDVLLTRDLYDFGQKQKHLKYMDTKQNNVVTFNVDFSYPRKLEQPQIGLF